MILMCLWGNIMYRNSCNPNFHVDRKFGKSILIVGNGPSVREHKLGSLVDSFDEVVRFNNYTIIPEYTGTKTTVIMHNAVVDPEENPNFKPSMLKICSQCQEWKFIGWGYWGRIQHQVVSGKFNFNLDNSVNCVPNGYIEKANKLVNYNSVFDVFRGPTSGFLSINYFLDRYDKVYIHGFDFYRPKDGSKPLHYYSDISAYHKIGMLFHQPDRELVAVQKLMEQGRVQLLKDMPVLSEQ
jgi:hypothetical protein